ncbi:MAG TPA: hypothetical protein VFE62_24020 [Gemmataceae bacterium]|nr:hypothetical protein [Gemmataceae bacterium]
MKISEAETALYYRGYYIESRADTTDPATQWVVYRTGVGGSYEEFGVTKTEKAAKRLVDEITTEPE